MKSILHALYSGDIHPAEDYISRSLPYKKLDEAFMRDSDAFSNKLDKTLAEEYERLLDAHTDLFAIQEEVAYIRGMRMGAQLALELLAEEK